ncbi:hypothetical protein GCM10011380_05550 [Sphingomonas metalli]|uniref:Uncharacterized protein n=1 Tax=Sphingomonas metalli TaxID=1779358 RepID=A0A916SUY3_9SPHN|nr:hypothetical protein GCM10011380_05550 [Sphingomonas metalli]
MLPPAKLPPDKTPDVSTDLRFLVNRTGSPMVNGAQEPRLSKGWRAASMGWRVMQADRVTLV